MATSLRRFYRLNISLANNAFLKYNFINVGVRFMYTDRDLGVISYENTRYTFRNQFMTIENTFREKMQEMCQNESGVIYTEDLKAMIHLAQGNDSDLQLLNDMLIKYTQNHEERRFGKYVFGPVVMRMYYHLNKPQHALEVFDNNALKESFDYRTCFRILMSLLYKNNMYKEMRETYQKVLDERGIDYIKSCNIIMYAGCLKENTTEALEFALKHWEEQFNEFRPSIRNCSLLSCLAIKHNKSDIALDILSTVLVDKAISIRCLKILAFAELERYVQIIPFLKYSLEQGSYHNRQQNFFADVICVLEEKLKAEDGDESRKILNLIDLMKKHNLLLSTITLEEYLLKPILLGSQSKANFRNTRDRRKYRNYYEPQTENKTELEDYL